MNKMTRLLLYLGMLCLSTPGYAERAEPVQYRPIVPLSGGVNATAAFLGSGSQAFNLTLPTLQIDLPAPVRGVVKTGEVFPLPAPVTAAQLTWEPLAGGYVARVHVVSEQAKRLRFHLVAPEGSATVQFRVQGNLNPSPLGPVSPLPAQGNQLWLPVTDGNAADVELFVGPATPPTNSGLKLDAVNVIVADVSGRNAAGVAPKLLGDAKFPQYDLVCAEGVVGASKYAALSQAASATAKINYINEKGQSYVCTGTLLSDTGNTQTPWFVTANHCLPTQAVANTATFEWFFQATQCGGKSEDPRYAQTYGGAALLYTDVTLEPSFLKLNQPPASGAVFSGWDNAISVGEEVWGVHHPAGDHTMISRGTVELLRHNTTDINNVPRLVDEVVFNVGGTEGGSSGSGLFALAKGVAYWKGSLFGGPDEDYTLGQYTDFPSYYNNVKPWLETQISPAVGAKVNCLLNWAEKTYPSLLSPAGSASQMSAPYLYRYYPDTRAYLGFSSVDNHLYYQGPDGRLQDQGDAIPLLPVSSCQ